MKKLKTRVVKNNCNPEWNEELTLSVKDVKTPIHLVSSTDLSIAKSLFLNLTSLKQENHFKGKSEEL